MPPARRRVTVDRQITAGHPGELHGTYGGKHLGLAPAAATSVAATASATSIASAVAAEEWGATAVLVGAGPAEHAAGPAGPLALEVRALEALEVLLMLEALSVPGAALLAPGFEPSPLGLP